MRVIVRTEHPPPAKVLDESAQLLEFHCFDCDHKTQRAATQLASSTTTNTSALIDARVEHTSCSG